MDSSLKATIQTMVVTIVSSRLMGGIGGTDSLSIMYYVIGAICVYYFESISQWVNDFFKRYVFKFEDLTYVLRSSITFSKGVISSNDVSSDFKAVMTDVINKLSEGKHNVRYDIENIVYNYRHETFQFIKLASHNNFINVGDNIWVNIQMTKKEVLDATVIMYKIKIKHTSNDMMACRKYIEKCTEDFTNNYQSSLKNQHVFILTDIKGEERDLVFSKTRFDTTKTFANLFFEGKSELMDRLGYFMNNKNRYIQLGMPYTFGMLFHGAPGTGKTSAIKAIANYTNRHIICVSVKKIKNIEDLRKIFFEPKINDMVVPHEKRLYVFEEIDCSQWAKITSKRAETVNDQTFDIEETIMCTSNGGAKITVLDKDKMAAREQPSITLGELLELLDGIVEIPGRIIIMTTNHPEKLDPALIRPGRIDMTVEFKKMRRVDVASMYELWWGNTIPSHIHTSLKDYVFTQAEIGYIFSKNDKTYAHNALRDNKKNEYLP